MAATLSEDIQTFVHGGVVVVVGTRDADYVGEISRGWGVRVLPGGRTMDVCVFAHVNRHALDNLADNRQVAVTLTSPSTYRSVQVKGRTIAVTEASRHHLRRVEKHLEAFLRELESVGLSDPIFRRLVDSERDASPELVKIRLEIDEIFDQTPGPAAGARL